MGHVFSANFLVYAVLNVHCMYIILSTMYYKYYVCMYSTLVVLAYAMSLIRVRSVSDTALIPI